MEQLTFGETRSSDIFREQLHDLLDALRMEYAGDVISLYNQISIQYLLHRDSPWLTDRERQAGHRAMGDEELIARYRHSFSAFHAVAYTPLLDQPGTIRRLLSGVAPLPPYANAALFPLMREFLEYAVTLRPDNTVRTSWALARAVADALYPEGNSPQPRAAVMDPACGTGAFLLAMGDHPGKSDEPLQLVGFEADSELRTACRILAYLADIPIDLREPPAEAQKRYGEYGLVLANPPLVRRKGAGEDLRIWDDPDPYRKAVWEIMESLAPGGRCALIVPDSFLFTVHTLATRQRKALLTHFVVEGIFKLPDGSFLRPTGVKASAIVFSRPDSRDDRRPATEKVLFYELSSLDTLGTVLSQRERYWAEWKKALAFGQTIENVKGIRIPLDRKDPAAYFAAFSDIERLDFALLPSYYQHDESIEYLEGDPQELWEELMGLEEEIRSLLIAVRQEGDDDV